MCQYLRTFHGETITTTSRSLGSSSPAENASQKSMATKARNQSSELGCVPHSQGRTTQRRHRRPRPKSMKTQSNSNAAKVALPQIVRRLVEARENLRWTQADLAKATGLQPAAISHFERGQRLPSLPNAVRLADALRVSLDWLTGRNDGVPKQHPFVEIDGVVYYPSPNDEHSNRGSAND